jgi:hypothetical protein
VFVGLSSIEEPTSSNSKSSASDSYCTRSSWFWELPVWAEPWTLAHWLELSPSLVTSNDWSTSPLSALLFALLADLGQGRYRDHQSHRHTMAIIINFLNALPFRSAGRLPKKPSRSLIIVNTIVQPGTPCQERAESALSVGGEDRGGADMAL